MELRLLDRAIHLTYGRMMAISIFIVGAALLLVAYSANADIVEIGETPDPSLQERISQLEDRRDLGLISGIGFAFLGLFGIAVLGEASTPKVVSELEMVSSARASHGILNALQVSGSAVYLPAKHGLTKERIFVPGGRGQTVLPSALTDDLSLSPGKDGSSPGVVLEPLGAGLLDHAEKELGTKLVNSGTEAAEGTLQILKHGMSLIRDFHFKERDGKTVMRVEYKDLLEACRTVRGENPDTCRQMACIGCACLLTAIARSTGKAVVVEDVDNSKDNVVFTLELREW